jgi:hypothetical protein
MLKVAQILIFYFNTSFVYYILLQSDVLIQILIFAMDFKNSWEINKPSFSELVSSMWNGNQQNDAIIGICL